MSRDDEQLFKEHCAVATGVFALRNQEYGSAFRECGVLGAVVEGSSCMARLRTLVIHSGDGGAAAAEKVGDILRDLHNYTVFALMMITEDNWKGV